MRTECEGLGFVQKVNVSALIDPNKSIEEWQKP